jgi:LysM repeat protein
MKNIQILVLSIFFLHNLGAQSNQLFFYAKADCANRMEYRYNAQSNSPGIVTYSMRQAPNQLFLFDMGAEGSTIFKALPKGTVSCSEAKLTEEIVRSINNGTRKAYILRDVQGGFSVSPIAQATQVVSNGAVYTVKSHNFDFIIDTEHLTTGENLAKKGSNSYIFYNGMYFSDCHSVYSFRREPDEACATRTDFDFIPNLGIISERTGTTTANALENEYSLNKINGHSSVDFLLAMCKGTTLQQQVAAVTESPNYNNDYILPVQHNQVAIEQDKENASIAVAPAPVTYSKPAFVGPRALVDCPEKPGEGYHIVQPGETLNAIARAYRLKVGAIITWNGLKDPDLLQTCQKVYITAPPGGVKTGIDQKTGNLVIADKPGKKGKNKGKNKKSFAPAPATYSTETVVAKSVKESEVAPQYAHWTKPEGTSKEEVRIQYVPQYIYVQVPADQKIEQPVQYVYQQPEKPVQYAYQPEQTPKEVKKLSAGTGILHTVQAGESLYSISRLYGFMPERFRKMNGLPENFVLQPGMKLTTTDCSCEAPRNFVTGAENPTNFTPQTTNKGGTFEEVDVVKPLEFNNNYTTIPTKVTSTRSGRFVEHVVREGETLGSISKRYNATTDDILNTNNIEATETLIAGMRLMIPR